MKTATESGSFAARIKRNKRNRDFKDNDQVELPPNGGSESKKGVVGG